MCGFSLAEVLITIGIIGIVAAITIPSIITKFKRQSAEVKLKKFYSVMNQAIQMSIAEHGDIYIDNENREDSNNSDYITTWYKEYLTKYIKTIKSEKIGIDYYEAIFADGSSFNSYMSATPPTEPSALYIFYCWLHQPLAMWRRNRDRKGNLEEHGCLLSRETTWECRKMR